MWKNCTTISNESTFDVKKCLLDVIITVIKYCDYRVVTIHQNRLKSYVNTDVMVSIMSRPISTQQWA